MSDAREVIDAQIAAFRERDLEGYLVFFADDVVVTDFAGHVLMEGLAGVRASYEPLFANSPDLSVDIISRIEIGDFVVDLEHLEGFNNPPFPVVFDAGVVYHVNDDKIAAMKFLM